MRREGIWYFHKFVNGKREFNGRKTPFSLETGDEALAKAKRDAILKAATGAEIDRVLGKESRAAATLGEIFAAYRAGTSIRADATTRRRNIADLERLVRLVKGAEFNVERAGSEILTKALVKEWQAARLAAARAAQGDQPDLAALESVKRGLNSTLTHVQSLFSAAARDDYHHLHLPPNIADFATALPVPARKQEAPVQLGDEFVARLLAEAEALQGADPGAWAAFQLMTWGGLRNKEALHARASWLEAVPAGYRLQMKATADFLPKGNSRAVILPAAVGQRILALGPAGGADAHLVPASTPSDRREACYRRLNSWLKRQGFAADANKIAYRLRKYFLAKVAEQQGIMFAQAAAGHSSLATTQDHYIGKPKMTAPIALAAVTSPPAAPVASPPSP